MKLQDRVTRIIKQPALEWPVIDTEPTDVATLYRSYIVPLAAIPAICGFIGLIVFGVSLPVIGTFRLGIAEALRSELFRYLSQLIMCYVFALIVAKLGPTFKSREDQVQALKLVAYSMTPVWLAGVLNLVPALSVLVMFAGLYALYLFYLGVPILMKTPADQVIPYVVVSVLVMIVVGFLLGYILALAGGAARAGGIA